MILFLVETPGTNTCTWRELFDIDFEMSRRSATKFHVLLATCCLKFKVYFLVRSRIEILEATLLHANEAAYVHNIFVSRTDFHKSTTSSVLLLVVRYLKILQVY